MLIMFKQMIEMARLVFYYNFIVWRQYRQYMYLCVSFEHPEYVCMYTLQNVMQHNFDRLYFFKHGYILNPTGYHWRALFVCLSIDACDMRPLTILGILG